MIFLNILSSALLCFLPHVVPTSFGVGLIYCDTSVIAFEDEKPKNELLAVTHTKLNLLHW
jgi:hypothetical protein